MAEVTYTGQIVREAPEIEAYKTGLLEEAKRLYATPVELPATQAAGLSTTQQQAIQLAKQGIGGYAPFLQAGSEAIAQGQNIAQAAAQGMGGLDVGTAFQPATALYSGAAQAYQPGMEQAYMNPYQQAVTQQALGEMRRQADIARQGQAAQAVAAGAFGGTREGVQRAEMERGLQDIMAQRILQDYAQNYGQAQQAAMAGFEAQQARQATAAQGLGSLAATQAGLGLQQASALGGLGQQIGSMGVQQAALGQAASQMGLQDVSTLSTLGQLEQANAQAQLDAIRATQLQQSMFPYQQLAFVSDIYKGAPSSQMALTTQSAPSASPLQSALGLGVGALSAAAGAQKVGLFGS